MIGHRTRLLAQTFFGRLFETDLFSSSVSASSGVTWLLAGLATPGMVFSVNQLFFYARVRTFEPDRQDRILFVSQAFHIDFAMAVAGLVTMLVWLSLTPDRRDALVLGPLPLRPGEQARARLLALTRFFSMFAAAVAVPTAVVFTFVTLGVSSVVSLMAHVSGHAVAAMLGAAFVFFTLLDVQIVAAATLGPAAVRGLTWPLQAVALVGMVAALSFTGRLADAMLGAQAPVEAAVLWNPAAWFMGLYRWIAGDRREIFAVLATRGLAAAGVAVLGAFVVYPLAYERCLRNAIVAEGQPARSWSGVGLRLWLGALRPLLRTPLERGLAAYIAATLTRSYAHRFLIGSYIGVGLLSALPLAGRLLGPATTAGARYAWLSVPLGLLCWSSAALRVAMMLPVEPDANWVFKLTEPADKRRVLSTAVTIVQGATALPIAFLFAAGAWVAGGTTLGLTVGVIVLSTGLALIELLTLTLRTVPCTCTYRPGQLRLRVLWPVYLFTWLIIAYQLPTLLVRHWAEPGYSPRAVAVLLAVWVALRTWRMSRARLLRSFVYEELEPPVTTTINLGPAGA